MKQSFGEGLGSEQESGLESHEEVMAPLEGPLLELLPIHFTTEQNAKIEDLFERNGFSKDKLPQMSESYARDTLIPLITEFIEAVNTGDQEEKGNKVIEALRLA